MRPARDRRDPKRHKWTGILAGLLVPCLLIAGTIAPAAADLLVGSGDAQDTSWVARYDEAGAFVSVFAGLGTGLVGPRGLAFGPDGHLYVSSFATGEILRFNGLTGSPMGVFVPGGNGNLEHPERLLFVGDDLWVTDFTGGAVRRYEAHTGLPMGDLVEPGSGGLSLADDMVIGPDGMLYVASAGSGEVLRYLADGTFDRVFVSEMTFPQGLAFDLSGRLLVTDSDRHEVRRFLSDGTADGIFASGSPLDNPRGLTQLADGRLRVVNQNVSNVLRYSSGGAFLDIATSADGLTDPAYDATVVSSPYVAQGQPASVRVCPGDPVQLVFCFTRVVAGAESLCVEITDTAGLSSLQAVLASSQGEELCFNYDFTVPSSFGRGVIGVVMRVRSAACVSGVVSCGVAVTVNAPHALNTCEEMPGPADYDRPATRTFCVTNGGSCAATFAYALDDPLGWASGAAMSGQALLGPAQQFCLSVQVRPPFGAAEGQTDSLQWVAYPINDPTYGDTCLAEVFTYSTYPTVAVETENQFDFAFATPYPNPITPSVNLEFTLPSREPVRLEIVDVAGRMVRVLVNRELPAGRHSVRWESDERRRPISAGIYFARLRTPSRVAVQRVVWLR